MKLVQILGSFILPALISIPSYGAEPPKTGDDQCAGGPVGATRSGEKGAYCSVQEGSPRFISVNEFALKIANCSLRESVKVIEDFFPGAKVDPEQVVKNVGFRADPNSKVVMMEPHDYVVSEFPMAKLSRQMSESENFYHRIQQDHSERLELSGDISSVPLAILVIKSPSVLRHLKLLVRSYFRMSSSIPPNNVRLYELKSDRYMTAVFVEFLRMEPGDETVKDDRFILDKAPVLRIPLGYGGEDESDSASFQKYARAFEKKSSGFGLPILKYRNSMKIENPVKTDFLKNDFLDLNPKVLGVGAPQEEKSSDDGSILNWRSSKLVKSRYSLESLRNCIEGN